MTDASNSAAVTAINNLSDEQAQRMLDAIMNPRPNNRTTSVVLHDAEEKDFPASMAVIRMSRSDDQIHIAVCKEEDINGAFTYTPIKELAFDAIKFSDAVQYLMTDE